MTILLLSSCTEDIGEEIKPQDDPLSSVTSEGQSTNARTANSTYSNYYQDGSGEVQIKIVWQDFGPGQHNQNKVIPIGSDYVVIGGGAWAQYTHYQDYGALLTESYPNSKLTGWIVGSKDHIEDDSHILRGYAIGLKLNGLSSSQLKNHIQLVSRTS